MSGFLVLRLASWIFGSYRMYYGLELYLGLLVFAGYILFDTQLIVERSSAGDMDHVKHALDLFVDFMAVLVRVLVILLKNKDRREQDSTSRRKERRA